MQKVDKIYFDIDGVLKGTASPQEDIVALLRYCLDNYAGSIYWLTTQHWMCQVKKSHFIFLTLRLIRINQYGHFTKRK